MIDAFETSVRINPNRVFFTFVDSSGQEISFTYKQARIISAALARRLKNQGVAPGDIVIAELSNSPEYIFLILAAAYANFTMALIDTRLSESDRVAQKLTLERFGRRVAMHIDDQRLYNMLRKGRDIVTRMVDASAVIESISGTPRWERSIMGQKQDIIDDTVHFAERSAHLFDASSLALIVFSSSSINKSKAIPLTWANLMQASTIANQALNERGRQLWQERLPLQKTQAAQKIQRRNSLNFISSDSGSFGNSSNVGSLGNLGNVGSLGNSSNVGSAGSVDCSWQCVFSLSHMRGFQILVRSVIGRSPLRLYETFDAELVLKDRERSHVTHISVSDKMLQDLLTVEEWRLDIQPSARVRLAEYQCILIDDRAIDPRTVERALDLGVRIFAGYGISETSGIVAESLITPDFHGGMRLMDGYEVNIVDANEDGFGRLAIKGPGVFEGYLNSSAAFTVDHFFITGNTAALYGDYIYIKSRATNTIVVDGETVYPTEIAQALRHIPGVSDVHVFGIADAVHGRIPVAVIERQDASITSDAIVQMSRQWLTDFAMPKRIYVSDSLPRLENGKLDRQTIEEMFRSSMKIKRMTLHYVRVPYSKFANSSAKLGDAKPGDARSGDAKPSDAKLGGVKSDVAKSGFAKSNAANAGEAAHCDSVIVELEDTLGRIGLGECAAFDVASIAQESLIQDVIFIRDVIAPNVIGRTFFHPRYTHEILSELSEIESHPMAASAVECAIWDLYGHVSEHALWELINDEYSRILEGWISQDFSDVEMPRVAKINDAVAKVGAGAVIELNPTPVAMANSHNAVAAGYGRLKIRVTPERGFACVRSVRRAFPELLITLDAGRSFKAKDVDQLKAYDSLNIGWIEEPFSPSEAEKLAQRIVNGVRSGESADAGAGAADAYGVAGVGVVDVDGVGVADAGDAVVGVADGVANGSEAVLRHFQNLSLVQDLIETPICVDESYRNAQEADEFLYSKNLHCISVKVAKFGGIEPTLRFLARAKLLGKVVVMGGIHETGIGRRISASFETLPGIVFSGDIGSISRYFEVDLTYPRYEASDGEIALNADGFEFGLGCVLDEEQLACVELERVILE